jgi:hypothetical protein
MTGPIYAERDPDRPERAAPPAPESQIDRILRLQETAGNAAVAGMLQRDALSMRGPSSIVPPLGSGSALGPAFSIDPDYVFKQQEQIKGKIRAYLEDNKPKVQGQILSGASIAELVDLVRTNVPESPRMAPEQVADVLRKWSGDVSIAEHRLPTDKKGGESEALATIKNALGKIPTEAKLERSGAFVKVSLSGLEAGYEKDEDTKATIGTESGKDVAVNLAAKGVHFAGKIEPGTGGEPTKWELGLTFPGEDMVPLIPTLGQVFGQASSSIGKVASDLKAGQTSVDKVKKQWAPVKEAVDSLSSIAGHSSVTFGVKVEGEGSEIKATATLTVTF